MFKNIYFKKKILITGHTGFKGSWLTLWLYLLGADLYGISLKPNKNENKFFLNLKKIIKNYFFDISIDKLNIKQKINLIKPDFIFHMAAQSIVSTSYKDPIANWKTNLFGTLNLLDSIKDIKKKCAIIIVTSDKCYEINEKKVQIFKEKDKLGGRDPYSASKACVEILTKSYFESFLKYNKNIFIGTVRAGNVIGGGDFSRDRIIPDCIKSWNLARYVLIRNPKHVRPWQHVLDALSGYLLFAKYLYNQKYNGESLNFGPSNKKFLSVEQLVNKLGYQTNNYKIKFKTSNEVKIIETKILKLNSSKSKKILNWDSSLNINQTISMTAKWYLIFNKNRKEILKLSINQIKDFYRMAIFKKNNWIK